MLNRLSKNFLRLEFVCKCGCGFDIVDAELIYVLEKARKHFGDKPLHITFNGGCRCVEWNEKTGGAKQSRHLLGQAADHFIHGVSHEDLQDYYLTHYPNQYGIGCYPNFTHIDVRERAARWMVQ